MKRSTKLLALSLLTASTVSFAHGHNNFKGETNFKDAVPCPVPATLMGGFYVGAQAGYDSYRVRESFSNSFVTGSDVTASTVSASGTTVHNATGWLGGLFLGYGEYFSNSYYLGGEIFGNLSNADAARHYTATETLGGESVSSYGNVEVKGNYGLSIIPGYKINDTTLGYVRLGWNWARVKGNKTDASVENGTAYSYTSGSTRTNNGFAWGLGMETKLVDNWSLRTEYNHTYFNNGSNNFDASDNQYSVGILYHFV